MFPTMPPAPGEIINELSLAIKAGVGLSVIGRNIHPYPTTGEAVTADQPPPLLPQSSAITLPRIIRRRMADMA